MPSFLTVVEDTSPLLVYEENWRAGTSETDNSMDQYTENTFTLTQSQGSSVKFQFYGFYVGVFGAKRTNHGNFSVQLDDTSYPSLNGESSKNVFNQSLFETDIGLGVHNLTVTNQGTTFFDIDYIAFETSIGQSDEDLIVNTFQDGHPAFQYMPANAWTIPSQVGTFSGASGRATIQGGAQATLTFEGKSYWTSGKNDKFFLPNEVFTFLRSLGDAVALYGPVGPNSVNAYSVSIDNGSAAIFNPNKQFYRSQQILFFAGNLGRGRHTMVVEVASPASGEFAIDYANVYSAPSLGGSYDNVICPTNSSSPIEIPDRPRQIPLGVMAGLAVLGALFTLSTSLSVYLYWRLRQKHQPDKFISARGLDPNSQLVEPFISPPSVLDSPAANRISSKRTRSSRPVQISERRGTSARRRSTTNMTESTSSAILPSPISDTTAPTFSSLPHSTPVGVVDDGTRYITLVLQNSGGPQLANSNQPPPQYT